MDTTDAFDGLRCVECGATYQAGDISGRCLDCAGILDPAYDLTAVDHASLRGTPDSMWHYDRLLPFDRETAISMGEGATPVVSCPDLAAELGIGELLVKDEGANPTGTFKDRGQSVAITAAAEQGADAIALASAGNAGQAAAAYAARAGVDAHVFLPSRAGFTQKAMVNVHGANLEVVEGRITDAGEAYDAAIQSHDDWHPVQTFVTPYRHEGKKTMLYEICQQCEWTAPDAIVYPTGGGVGLVGMDKGARELNQLGLISDRPSLYAAQSTGCSPIVDAFEAGRDVHEIVDYPDTVCGGIEIPNPGASNRILDAIRSTDGGAVATDDDAILDAAIRMARETGLDLGHTCAAAASGTFKLAARGEFDADDTVVILNTGTANKNADVIRSHLMSR